MYRHEVMKSVAQALVHLWIYGYKIQDENVCTACIGIYIQCRDSEFSTYQEKILHTWLSPPVEITWPCFVVIILFPVSITWRRKWWNPCVISCLTKEKKRVNFSWNTYPPGLWICIFTRLRKGENSGWSHFFPSVFPSGVSYNHYVTQY